MQMMKGRDKRGAELCYPMSTFYPEVKLLRSCDRKICKGVGGFWSVASGRPCNSVSATDSEEFFCAKLQKKQTSG